MPTLGIKQPQRFARDDDEDIATTKQEKVWLLAKDILSAKCFQFVSVFVYSWGDHGPFFQHCWIIVPYPEMARWQEDIWVGSFHIDLFVIHIPKKKETNMTRKIHHEWKCTSYSTWGLSNTSCYFLGVDIHRIAMYIFRPLNASDAFSTCIGTCFFWDSSPSSRKLFKGWSMCHVHPSFGARWQCFCKRFPGSSVPAKRLQISTAISIHTRSMLKHITWVFFSISGMFGTLTIRIFTVLYICFWFTTIYVFWKTIYSLTKTSTSNL